MLRDAIKRLPWKTVILTILCWTIFWDTWDTITGDQPDILTRAVFWDKSYAKNIEIRTYLLTDDQVLTMLSHPNEPIQQPNQRELTSKNLNVVLRMRNMKGGLAFGKLAWTMPGMGWNLIDVHEIERFHHSPRYSDIVIPVGVLPMEQTDDLPGSIKVSWESFSVHI